ncbi:DUF885 domain-containing protein [Sphingosinicella sp. LY1275]|uniref:DUF885 domain-containing protein n=1 Tax=Sphingosinicella sp. LY1275 TaxID=3095379 RepID=UPI002ADEB173|nr:DUF885 domain-containing protein [Sphingosinicella sp. LY1275]MEA1014060.1 DUF885 domain-containing protein [Sphingosinicella sp. LY1275]
MKTLGLLLCGAATLLAGCAQTSATVAPATAAAAESPSQALAALFAASDQGNLERNPVAGLYRGDMRYADRYGDYVSDAYYDAEREAARSELAALARIDREALSPSERVSYDVFKWQREIDLRGLEGEIFLASAVRPIDHFRGFHANFAELSSGEGVAPYKTVADYENGLKRVPDFVRMVDGSIARMKQGNAAGIVQPKLVMDNVVEQLDAMLAEGVEGSSFYRPAANFPAEIPAADQARLKAAYAATIRDDIRPALTRLRDFIKTDYLPQARTSVGLGDMKGGPALYSYLVETSTTTKMTPDQIHRIGLDNVALIHAEMEKVKAQVGFKGTLKAFFEHIRTDPKFKPASREALQQGYVAIGKRLDATLPRLFSTLPRAPLEIRPVPALTEKGAARGSYNPGTPDGSRPGVFYFNAYDLPSRTTPGMETLYLHEGAPGHHFQISLAQENEALPNFQRFGGNTAYVEGWGLYAETLGKELGVYTDPYQYFGYLDSQLFRAIRLVVDTGIHSKGWSRDQTIQYILDNSSRGRSNATAETERYIAMPGQALAYKIGQLKISELRARAEQALGSRFDIREFHEQVLGTGALPLAVLETKIDDWIASKRG